MILTELSNTQSNIMNEQSNESPEEDVALDEKILSTCDAPVINTFICKIAKILENYSYNTLEDSICQENTCFNVFGSLGPTLANFSTLFNRSLTLAVEIEQSSSKGQISLIDSLTIGKELNTAFENILKTLSRVFLKIQKGFMISELLRQNAVSLAKLINFVIRNKMFKHLTVHTVDCVSKILHRFQHASSGPYDGSFFSLVETFFATCFLHSNAGLRNAAVTAWKATFDQSRDLVYTDVFKKALLKVGKRYALYIPDNLRDSNDDEEENPVAPLKKATGTPKRILAIVDDDSTDYVPIASNASKKMKLTEHQKEMFTSTKDKLPFIDEDSIQNASRLKSLPSNFDLETSRSGFSNSVSAPQEVTVVAVEPPVENEPKFRRTAIRLNFDEVAEVNEAKKIVKSESVDESSESVDETRKETVSRRARTKATPSKYAGRKRAISESGRTEDTKTEKSSFPQTLATPKRSRRLHKKKLGISDRVQRSVQNRDCLSNSQGSQSSSQSSCDSSDEVDSISSRGSLSSELKSSSDENEVTVLDILEEVLTEEDEPANVTIKMVEASENEAVSEVPNSNQNRTPEKSCPIETLVSTPSTVRVLEHHTPGILKKLNSPSTSERKRLRVHFHESNTTSSSVPNVSINFEGEESPVLEEQSDCSVFPELEDSNEPIGKIISKLLPITSMGSSFLKGALKNQGVFTVGDLAKLSKRKVNSLPFRLPREQTVVNALQAFLASTKPAMVPPIVEDAPLKDVPLLEQKGGSQESFSSQSSLEDVVVEKMEVEIGEIMDDSESNEDQIPGSSRVSSNFEKLRRSLLNMKTNVDVENVTSLSDSESAEILKLINKTMQALCHLQNNLLNKL